MPMMWMPTTHSPCISTIQHRRFGRVSAFHFAFQPVAFNAHTEQVIFTLSPSAVSSASTTACMTLPRWLAAAGLSVSSTPYPVQANLAQTVTVHAKDARRELPWQARVDQWRHRWAIAMKPSGPQDHAGQPPGPGKPGRVETWGACLRLVQR